MSSVLVLEPGLLTTVQDLGRESSQEFGIPVSGVMDLESMYLANALVGKDLNSPVLECTYLGPSLKFINNMSIAITGGDLSPCINGIQVDNNQTITIKANDILSFKGLKNGLRAYISFSDDLVCDFIYDSSSTYLKASFGGYKGRKLRKNDLLDFSENNFNNSYCISPIKKDNNIIRIMKSFEYEAFEKESVDKFLNSKYKLSNDSDRMGMRFEGHQIKHISSADIISSPIVPGTIQIPKSGQAIIMMKDAQTIGGYTRFGSVITCDLDKLAQLKPGDEIEFSLIELKEAQEIKKAWLKEIKEKTSLDYSKKNTRSFRAVINSKYYDIKVEEI